MKLFAAIRPPEKPVPGRRAIEPEVAEQVGQEILHQRLEPAAWATALAASGGRRQDALAAYARIRIDQLSSQRRLRHAKSRSFEARRLTNCLGIKTVQDLLQRSNRGGQLNLIKPRLSFVWLFILLVGSAGSVASLGRLLGGQVPDRIAGMLPLVALLGGVLAVAGMLALRTLLPKRWVMLGWNSGLLAACTVACFGSLCLGAKLIARTQPEVIQRISSREPAPRDLPREPAQLVKPRLPSGPALASTAAVEKAGGEE
jgi:hypothetical protein